MGLILKQKVKDIQLIKFETYRFYLECIVLHIKNKYGTLPKFGITCLARTQKLQGRKDFDSDWVERFMKIAWNTEYLLMINTSNRELIRFNNQWTPIQAYYAVYAACEAVGYLLDGNQSGSHQKALKKMTEHFVKSGLSPWNKAFNGARGKSKNNHCPINFPKGMRIPHNLERISVDPLAMIACCLRAEHSNRVDEKWGSRKKSKVYKYEYNPGNTGILHFLYRLRLKCNYEEIDPYVIKPSVSDIANFANNLMYICSRTLFYLEAHLIRKCSKAYLLEIGRKYLEINSNAKDLERRLKFFENNV